MNDIREQARQKFLRRNAGQGGEIGKIERVEKDIPKKTQEETLYTPESYTPSEKIKVDERSSVGEVVGWTNTNLFKDGNEGRPVDEELHSCILDSNEEGMNKTDISKFCGCSRTTVHKVIKEER